MKLDVRVQPGAGGTRHEDIDRPDGPAIAALIAAGIGAFFLGLFTTLAEASASLKDWLNYYDPVGPLSGKTTYAVIAFLVSWAVLHPVLRTQPKLTNRYLWVIGVLLFLGLLGTFPTFFEAFAPAE